MRTSWMMERYAQRAVDKRRAAEASRKLENRVLASYLAQGSYLQGALQNLPFFERMKYIAEHSELIVSSDGAEGINVVWCPNSQILTHRLLSPEMRKEFGGEHYLGTWVRNLSPLQRFALKKELEERLEKRVLLRTEQRKQLPIDFDDELDDGIPLFLHMKG